MSCFNLKVNKYLKVILTSILITANKYLKVVFDLEPIVRKSEGDFTTAEALIKEQPEPLKTALMVGLSYLSENYDFDSLEEVEF